MYRKNIADIPEDPDYTGVSPQEMQGLIGHKKENTLHSWFKARFQHERADTREVIIYDGKDLE